MSEQNLLAYARTASGLSQAVLAARSGTSRPTLSAYEHARKSPSLDTASRILSAAGFTLAITPKVEFRQAGTDRGRPIMVPNRLVRLPIEQALRIAVLPLHLNWSDPDESFDLRDRGQRVVVYERVIREGRPEDVLAYIDGALLVDLWDDLVLPAAIHQAWNAVVTATIVRES